MNMLSTGKPPNLHWNNVGNCHWGILDFVMVILPFLVGSHSSFYQKGHLNKMFQNEDLITIQKQQK